MITTEELGAAILEKKQEIIAAIVSDLKEGCKSSLGWELQEQLKRATKEIFEEHLKADIKAMLLDQKDVIKDEAHKALVLILANLGANIEAEMTKKLSCSWERGKMLKAIFE
jgi:hypothetical protein